MAVRFYLSDLIGTGSEGDPFRPAAGAVGNYAADDGRQDSTVVGGRMLVRMDVSPAQHATLLGMSGVTYLPLEDAGGNPLGPLDTIGSIPAATRNTIRTRLEAFGVDTDDLTLADPIREVLRRIRRRLRLRNAVLNALDFTEGLDTIISDIAPLRRSNITSRLQARGFDTSVVQPGDTIRVALRKLLVQINVGS